MQSSILRTGLLLLGFAVATNVSALEPIRAKALRPGDTIMVVAPARTPDEAKMKLAKQRLEAMGYKVLLSKAVFQKLGYLAGTDEQRAEQIMSAFSNDDVDAIFCATGGFGTTRMLDLLDYDVIRKHPKIFTGYSDITGLHLAINQKTGLVTFHGPNLDSGLGIEKNLTPFSAHWFFRAITATSDGYAIKPADFQLTSGKPFSSASFRETCELEPPKTLSSGKATGQITGGNLTLVAALMGTPYEIDTKGKILFLEDIGEAPYRVDRMLSTLKLAGKLDEAAGIVLGTFTYRSDQDTSNEGQSLNQVLASYFSNLATPVIQGFPFGHHACNATLPIGADCEIDSNSTTVRILNHPVESR